MDFQADSNDFESSDNRPVTPPELIGIAATATKQLLPSKSHNRYEQVYQGFQQWKKLKETTSNSERVLLAYFTELKQNCVSSTLWAKYSMLKSTMKINDQVDISTYASLNAMLKKESKGHIPKQARTFTENELKLFIDTAPDDLWLDVKVVCVFGLCGACRSHELASVIMEHIVRYKDMYFVTIPREFTKTDKDNALFHVVKKYEALRPSHVKTDRFFLNFQKGKCTVQVIGKSKFYGMSRRIAEFLKLPDPERYTGHSFRRTSATIYANAGASIEDLKRHTGQKSTAVCERYIDSSIGYKRKTENAIVSALNGASTSSSTVTSNESFSSVINSSGMNETPVLGSALNVASTSSSTVTSNEPFSSVINSSGMNETPVVGSASGTSNSSSGNQHKRKAAAISIAQSGDDTADSGNGNDNDAEVASQMSVTNEVSTQNFLASMEKRFAFYKCSNLSFNFRSDN